MQEIHLFDLFIEGLEREESSLPKDKKNLILPEISILKEVKDILDELNIIKNVFQRKRSVLNDALGFFARVARSRTSENSRWRRYGSEEEVNVLTLHASDSIRFYGTLRKLDFMDQRVDKIMHDAKQLQDNVNCAGLIEVYPTEQLTDFV